MKFCFSTLVLACAAGAAAWGVPMSAAQAQSCDSILVTTPPKGEGAGHAGAVLLSGEDCYGSGARRTEFLPVLNYRWRNGVMAGTTYGLGYAFESPEFIQVGLRLTPDWGRKARRAAVLSGMHDVDPALEAGGFLNLFFSRQVFVTSTLRYGSGNEHRGLRADVRAHYVTEIAPRWKMAWAVGATLANRSYMQNYFGVSAQEEVLPARPAYAPGSGLRDVRAIALLSHAITPQWDAVMSVTMTSLQGDAKRSPIVQDRRPVNGMLAVTRDF